MVQVKAYYYIDERHTSMSCNVQSFSSEEDADNAAWLCATMPGCVSAQVVKSEPSRFSMLESVVRVYARGDSGFVVDFTELADSIRQLREAGAEFARAE